MTAFDMYFIATLCPVIVCVATVPNKKMSAQYKRRKKKIRVRTFDLSKGALCDVFCDGVLPQLRWGKDVGNVSHGDEGRLEDVDGAIADGGRGVAVVGFVGLGATFQIAQIWV